MSHFYNSTTRKLFRRRWGVQSPHVQDHHVIPKQWKKHPSVIRYDININSYENIIMMPTYSGYYKLNIRPIRYIHDGGHYKYNVYVKDILDSLNCIKCEQNFRKEFKFLLTFLKRTLRFGDDIIPWT